MDIVTQTVLGGAVGEMVLGKKAGNKAIMWGAVGGLIPDLDILVTPFYSEVDGLFVHRGFSHAIIFAFLLAPLLGWLIHQIHKKKTNIKLHEWIFLIFMAAFTHPILDYFTTYGTGAFLPFSNYRIEFSTIAIVDIFYTVPFIVVLLTILFLKRTSATRRKLIVGLLFLTSLYLLGTVVNKAHINSVFKKAFAKHEITYSRYKTAPLPLTNFLWMGMAESDSGYYVALYSNFDNQIPANFEFIPRNEFLLEDIKGDKALKKLIRFSKGYYHVNKDEKGLYLADLRFGKMGIGEDATFVFKFYIRNENGEIKIEQSQDSRAIKENAFSKYLNRIIGNT